MPTEIRHDSDPKQLIICLKHGNKSGFQLSEIAVSYTDSISPFMQWEQCFDRLSFKSILLAKPAGVDCSVCSYIYLHMKTYQVYTKAALQKKGSTEPWKSPLLLLLSSSLLL